MITKICNKCGEEKELRYFSKYSKKTCYDCYRLAGALRTKKWREKSIKLDRKLLTIECIYCKKLFNKRRPHQIYCSRNCKLHFSKNRVRNTLLLSKELICSLCGFKALNKCQLDIDHIDGNHKNDQMENLQLICANCHRYKTYLNKDWKHNN